MKTDRYEYNQRFVVHSLVSLILEFIMFYRRIYKFPNQHNQN